jgi:hypothetical protein
VPVEDNTKSDIRAAKRLRLPWWGVLLGIVVSTFGAWLFDHLGRLDLALPTLNSILVLGVVAAVKRKLWRYASFWIMMTIVTALHVEAILLISWTTTWVPAVAIGIMDSLDFTVVLAILNLVAKSSGGAENRL